MNKKKWTLEMVKDCIQSYFLRGYSNKRLTTENSVARVVDMLNKGGGEKLSSYDVGIEPLSTVSLFGSVKCVDMISKMLVDFSLVSSVSDSSNVSPLWKYYVQKSESFCGFRWKTD